MKFKPEKRIIKLKNMCFKYRSKNKVIYSILWLIYNHYQVKYGVRIPARVTIGSNFKIEHANYIIVNEYSSIGNNVKLFNGVLIGRESRGKRKGSPIKENNACICAKATMVGNVKIGNNVLIAPNSFINFDVPYNSVVIGNPGVIHYSLNATNGYL